MAGQSIPIIVGVGDFKNPFAAPEKALEPYQLMIQAIQRALQDTYLPEETSQQLQKSIDSIDVVATWSWPYQDLPGLLSTKLGVDAAHKFISNHGGNQPAKLVDEAARRIAQNKTKVAVVTGGEALASLGGFAAARKMPQWSARKKDQKSGTISEIATLGDNTGSTHGIGLPIHVYPLYENASRASRGQSLAENNEESASLYADFAAVAQGNTAAWSFGKMAATKEEIGTVTKKNRMICYPYPLLMNAFNNVNLAGAVILTSTDYATELGIPKSQWVYPLGGAGTKDSDKFWERPNFYTSPSITRSLDAGLEVCGLTKEQIGIYDFYSCFPIVPKIACQHLGLAIESHTRPLTLLGGLTSFGGAGNNYSMHAITEMTRNLRERTPTYGLVLANGGTMTYQHVLLLSAVAPSQPYPSQNPLPPIITDVPVPAIVEEANGEATIETYTVEFNRDGTPDTGHVVGRLPSGERFLANHADEVTLAQLVGNEEPVGRRGWVRNDDGRNLFSFEKKAKL
ncbi:hypothetical protein VE03_05447 [Pseudogymnoascus sp. 23342-1-I1]|nr:hypothetical protein VE03_05447 [Pseudogymnoascus sp. 23342-1-I1]